jgi:hypothetical protein
LSKRDVAEAKPTAEIAERVGRETSVGDSHLEPVATLVERKSPSVMLITGDQGREMAQHAHFSVETWITKLVSVTGSFKRAFETSNSRRARIAARPW